MLERMKSVLEKRGYAVQLCRNAQEAAEYILTRVEPGQTVGVGGSVTVQQLGLEKLFAEKGCPVRWHWLVPPPERAAEQVAAHKADVYLCSANALTEAGQIINIDGHGNRVAATLHGPGKVIFVIGKNKVAPNYEAAIERIQTGACVANARRLGRNTPCAALGKCTDCDSPDRMCRATVVLERAVTSHPMEVVLVDEELGY
jgi:L-lactate utilization protein LutB